MQLRLAQALIDAQAWDELYELLAEIERDDPWEWRAHWYRGLAALARRLPADARASFEVVYHAIPGELAPKLALGVCAELAGEHAVAAGWYDIVSRTDAVYSTATFGLARCRLACGDRAGALAAYERVPDSASAHDQAQIARIGCLLGDGCGRSELAAAAAAIDALDVEGEQRAQLTAELLRAALELVVRDGGDPAITVAGCALDEQQLRLGLERTYRALAAVAASADERIRLVDEANRVRPRTWTMSAFAVAAFHDDALALGAGRVDAVVWVAAGRARRGRRRRVAARVDAARRAHRGAARGRAGDRRPAGGRGPPRRAHGEFPAGRWTDCAREYELAVVLEPRGEGDRDARRARRGRRRRRGRRPRARSP